MLTLRHALRFCRTKTYIAQFDNLETEVNRLESEVLQKKEELNKFNEITKLSTAQYVLKSIMKLANQPFQYQALREEREIIKDLQQELKQLTEVGDQRAGAMKKMKKQQQEAVETVFLTDLAKFSLSYHQIVKQSNLPQDLQTGIELSHKSLDKVLLTEKVEWIGSEGDEVDLDLHSPAQDSLKTVKQVERKGFKVKGKIIEKAKVK